MRGTQPALRPGDVIEGRCVAEVLDSCAPGFARGDLVSGIAPWSEEWIGDAARLSLLDAEIQPPQVHLGPAGVPGLTAYVGLLDIGNLKAGETVLVSSAAGAVGSMACQIALNQGCRVIGTVGSAEKARWLRDRVGIAAAVVYPEEPDLANAFRRLCPGGADLVFECVGGRHLEAGIEVLRPHGRVVLCGLMGSMNGVATAPSNLDRVIMQRLTISGFVVGDHLSRMAAFRNDVKSWISGGRLQWRETVFNGIESVPRAFVGLFEGTGIGKTLVRVGTPDTIA
jgi:NADPH-dependent curcumin reductase CurA